MTRGLKEQKPKKREPHSPGPWTTSKGDEDDPNRWAVVADRGDKPFLIATIENGQPGDCLETEEATARLVAAAPEILSALRFLTRYLREFERWPIKAEHMAYLATAEKAIAKAEGD